MRIEDEDTKLLVITEDSLPLAPARESSDLAGLGELFCAWLLVNGIGVAISLPVLTIGGTAGASSRARLDERTRRPIMQALEGAAKLELPEGVTFARYDDLEK